MKPVKPLRETLNAKKALIFRITHRQNVPWLLRNGLRCSNSRTLDPNFVSIGNPELIDKRGTREVPISPGGTLSDYVPFYFTPFSPMLYNIKTGSGVSKRASEDIVILVTSLRRLEALGHGFIFTDRHAYLRNALFFSDFDELDMVDWELLQRRDFKRDREDPGKFERYQAEALVHRHLPASAFLGVSCYTDPVRRSVEADAASCGLDLEILRRRGWYF